MIRVGQGYDVHPLREDRPLWLAGVEVPHEYGLHGDSDADVGLHALMDALLGAIGAGDLGSWFPKDRVSPGISSVKLMAEVMADVRARGFRVVNADVTIMAQAPRLSGYRQAMVEAVVRLLDCPAVSIKFKTGDGLGVVGRREGMAALAVVLVESEEGP